jgi:mono/diheme cytochrome c family protein
MIMTSQDVIHSFYIPAFRVKQDVVPGRYTTMWFEATREGEYHLFCAEYCGTEHSRMGGRVVAMSVADYERWLVTPGEVILPDGSAGAAVGPIPGAAQGDPMALVGGQLFANLGCAGCHRSDSAGTGPSLQGLFGNQGQMADGSTITADEGYLAESILNPQAKVAAGYGPPSVMPAYAGQLSDDQVNQLIAYIKSLSDNTGADGGQPNATAAPGAPTTTAASTPVSTAAATGGAAATPEPAAAPVFDAALAAPGEQIFASLGCVGCHRTDGVGPGPSLVGIYNAEKPLADGTTITADEAYLIESIINAQAKVVQGYQPIMPAYGSQLNQSQVAQLVEYIKSLGK